MKRGLIGLSIVTLILTGCSLDTDTSSTIDERTCEIFRDIALNADIQTLEETRDRIDDLYHGYGQSTSVAIHEGLRDMLEGFASGDGDHISEGITATDQACKVEGF